MTVDIRQLPSPADTPFQVYHFPSPRWRGKVSTHLTFDAWEWGWFQRIQPTNPRLIINGNGRKGHEIAYARFSEVMPNGKAARHTLARYLTAMRARILYRLLLGPAPEKRGPPIGLIDGDPCNLLPSNRKALSDDAPLYAPYEKRKRGHDADWSARIRVDAIFDGKDPEQAWAEEVERINAGLPLPKRAVRQTCAEEIAALYASIAKTVGDLEDGRVDAPTCGGSLLVFTEVLRSIAIEVDYREREVRNGRLPGDWGSMPLTAPKQDA